MRIRFVRLTKGLASLIIVSGAVLNTAPAFALDACKILLCLADPRGPKTEAECVPDITELFEMLSRGKPFPTCSLAGGSHVEQKYNYFDDCPSGTTELPTGSYAIQSTTVPRLLGGTETIYTGIGSGEGYAGTGQGKVCVGSKVGDTYVSVGQYDDARTSPAGVYSTVFLMRPQWSPRIIDVFIGNALQSRVRW